MSVHKQQGSSCWSSKFMWRGQVTRQRTKQTNKWWPSRWRPPAALPYDKRFGIGYTEQQKRVLANFRRVL